MKRKSSTNSDIREGSQIECFPQFGLFEKGARILYAWSSFVYSSKWLLSLFLYIQRVSFILFFKRRSHTLRTATALSLLFTWSVYMSSVNEEKNLNNLMPIRSVRTPMTGIIKKASKFFIVLSSRVYLMNACKRPQHFCMILFSQI